MTFSLLTAFSISGQSNIPQVVSFSAVVRDQNNQPLVNTPVSLRLSFHQGAPTDPIVYCALHQDVTNANGFISVQLNRNVLGTGCNNAPNDPFESISWEDGNMWLEVEYQTLPGDPFVSLGTLELASSFYAFAAGTAESLVGFQLEGALEGDVITYNAATGQWEASPPGFGFSGDYADLTNAPTNLSDFNNDLNLSIDYSELTNAPANLSDFNNDLSLSNDYNDLVNTPQNVSSFVNDAGYISSVNGLDVDPFNELQTINQAGTSVTLSQGGGTFSVADGDTALWKQNSNGIHYQNGFVGLGLANPSTLLDLQYSLVAGDVAAVNLNAIGGNFPTAWEGIKSRISGGSSGNQRAISGWSQQTSDTENMGVGGFANGGRTNHGVYGGSYGTNYSSTGINSGITGQSGGSQGSNYGVWGSSYSVGIGSAYGIYGESGVTANNFAGFFNGNVTVTGTIFNPSDKRLKSDIQIFNSGLSIIRSLKPVKYVYSQQAIESGLNLPKAEQIGFLAQDVEEVLPSLVTSQTYYHSDIKDGSDKDAVITEFKAVNYLGIIPILVQSIKEQDEQIQNLEDKIKQLEKKLDAVLSEK